MPKDIICVYIKRKAAVDVHYVSGGGNIGKTVDYIQQHADELRDKPVILHTGTNDVVRDGSRTTEHRLQRLGSNLKHNGYSCVALSGIIHRSSTERVSNSVKRLSFVLQCMCLRNKWTYKDNDFIYQQCLSHNGPHLNGMGSELLTTTITKGVTEFLSFH